MTDEHGGDGYVEIDLAFDSDKWWDGNLLVNDIVADDDHLAHVSSGTGFGLRDMQLEEIHGDKRHAVDTARYIRRRFKQRNIRLDYCNVTTSTTEDFNEED